jgi:hypothetical protein
MVVSGGQTMDSVCARHDRSMGIVLLPSRSAVRVRAWSMPANCHAGWVEVEVLHARVQHQAGLKGIAR